MHHCTRQGANSCHDAVRLPNSQISECICSISHNAPFRTEMCISHNAPFRTEMYIFMFLMKHCGIWQRCILGFVKLVYWTMGYTCSFNKNVIENLVWNTRVKTCVRRQLPDYESHNNAVTIECLLRFYNKKLSH